MKRSILRHYVGNREDIVIAMARRFIERYRAGLAAMAAWVGEKNHVDRSIECLFASSDAQGFRDVLIVESLIAEAGEDQEIRDIVTAVVEETIAVVRDGLRLAYPKASAKQAWTVANGVVGICFNHSSLTPLGLPKRHDEAARRSARLLIETLGA